MRKLDGFAAAIVRLYPRAWRARYEDEMIALVEDKPVSVSTIVDLAGGALREWVRTLSRQPGPLVDLTRERRRDLIAMLVRPAFFVGFCWAIAQPLRGTTLAQSESPWFYLLLLPLVGGIYRGLRVGARSRRVLSSDTRSPQTTAEALAALGLGRTEYRFWLTAFGVVWTFYFAHAPTGFSTFHKLYTVASFGYYLNNMHACTGSALVRRWKMVELARADQPTKQVIS